MTLPVASYIAKAFLVFSNATIITPLLFFGFLSRGSFFIKKPTQEDSTIWGNACLLVLFSMIFSAFLKSLFQIPLNPALGIKGFAFPSGHMLVAVVFYGWLMCSYPIRQLRAAMTMILFGTSFGLIQQGYHNLWDVLGAVGFGMAVLYAFRQAYHLPLIAHKPVRMAIILILLSFVLVAFIGIRIDIPQHITKTVIGLIGFAIIWASLNRTLWKHTNNDEYC
jgi:hypothetical protein